jgi:anti-anti-sigma regulatory factor
MLKISRDETSNGRTEIWRVQGHVVGNWVGELRRTCDRVLGESGRKLVLDLRDVTFIDPDGIALFRELSSRHVELTNCSLFAAEQLKELTACSKSVL